MINWAVYDEGMKIWKDGSSWQLSHVHNLSTFYLIWRYG